MASKLSLLFLLAILLWCNAGFVAWNAARTISYEYVRSHRSELKFRDTIVVSASDFKGSSRLAWMKKDEICYLGQMYDVKKEIRQADGSVKLIGHYDKFENKLFKSLESLLGGHAGTTQKNKSTPLWLCEAVMPTPPALKFNPVDHIEYLATYYCVILKHSREVMSPPPDRAA